MQRRPQIKQLFAPQGLANPGPQVRLVRFAALQPGGEFPQNNPDGQQHAVFPGTSVIESRQPLVGILAHPGPSQDVRQKIHQGGFTRTGITQQHQTGMLIDHLLGWNALLFRLAGQTLPHILLALDLFQFGGIEGRIDVG